MAKKVLGKGLGKGLGALLSVDGIPETQKDSVVELKINDISPNSEQPRKRFNEDALQELADSIKENVARVCLHQSKVSEEQTNTANLAKATDMIKRIIAQRQAEAQSANSSDTKRQPVRVDKSQKVGRNDPCPCGSGKKYKNCCGRNQ